MTDFRLIIMKRITFSRSHFAQISSFLAYGQSFLMCAQNCESTTFKLYMSAQSNLNVLNEVLLYFLDLE